MFIDLYKNINVFFPCNNFFGYAYLVVSPLECVL